MSGRRISTERSIGTSSGSSLCSASTAPLMSLWASVVILGARGCEAEPMLGRDPQCVAPDKLLANVRGVGGRGVSGEGAAGDVWLDGEQDVVAAGEVPLVGGGAIAADPAGRRPVGFSR